MKRLVIAVLAVVTAGGCEQLRCSTTGDESACTPAQTALLHSTQVAHVGPGPEYPSQFDMQLYSQRMSIGSDPYHGGYPYNTSTPAETPSGAGRPPGKPTN